MSRERGMLSFFGGILLIMRVQHEEEEVLKGAVTNTKEKKEKGEQGG